jgi:hypothetical protein
MIKTGDRVRMTDPDNLKLASGAGGLARKAGVL